MRDVPTRFVVGGFGASTAALDAFRRGSDVEVDLAPMASDERRRVIDLVSGAVYSLDGEIKRVAKDVYRLSRTSAAGGGPAGVREPRRPNHPAASGAVAIEVTAAR